MAKGITDSQHYTNIAAAIRSQNGEETTYKPSEMAAAILALVAGGSGESGSEGKTIASFNIYEETGMFAVTYTDGTMVTGSATFDANGLPTGLTDDNGSAVYFVSGYPVGAKDSGGNGVSIVWE